MLMPLRGIALLGTVMLLVLAAGCTGSRSTGRSTSGDMPLDSDSDGLPDVIELRAGSDPKLPDTDGDRLTDSFELLKMGLLTDPRSADSDRDGIGDADEDLDGDMLTNLEEQACGTDPLVPDTDHDSLSDAEECAAGTGALSSDGDHDGLRDDSERRLGTDPRKDDTDGDGILDGEEIFTSVKTDPQMGIAVALTGQGDLASSLRFYNESSPICVGIPAVRSRCIRILDDDPGKKVYEVRVTLAYDPELVDIPANLALYVWNETWGTYFEVPSTVDTGKKTVTGVTDSVGLYIIQDTVAWKKAFER